MISTVIKTCFPVAAQTVAAKADDINKLNVFPVPDGDTGTNMSLTLKTVVGEIEALPQGSSIEDIAKAITHGSLMGARGNSGVITSQILRGLAEGLCSANQESPSAQDIAFAFKNAQEVAFKAVRKPVEGTILTVLRDVTTAAQKAKSSKLPVDETLKSLVIEAYESVARTPDLLPVLKENGVVDSGAYGFACFLEAFVNAALNLDTATEIQLHNLNEPASEEASKSKADSRVAIELNDDWEGSEFRYCTEFLFKADSKDFNEEKTLQFLTTMGDCELLVGANPDYKVHVHTNEPNKVLEYMLQNGQIYEVFIHNMDLEAQDRTAKIAADMQAGETVAAPQKELGFVAVAAGSGEAEILKSLGVDVVVSGGQTMNPSTADLLLAIQEAHAKKTIVLPNNSNIVMAAEAAKNACDTSEVYVVPSKSIPQAFSALFAIDHEADVEDIVEEMKEAVLLVRDGEVTTAVRDSQTADGSPIHAGDVMGIVSGKILETGSSVHEVTLSIIAKMMDEEEGDTLTILAGQDMDDEQFEDLTDAIEEAYPDLEVDAHRGEQPLYPVIFSLE